MLLGVAHEDGALLVSLELRRDTLHGTQGSHGDEFAFAIEKLTRFLGDGYIDRFESKELIESLAQTLRALNDTTANA